MPIHTVRWFFAALLPALAIPLAAQNCQQLTIGCANYSMPAPGCVGQPTVGNANFQIDIFFGQNIPLRFLAIGFCQAGAAIGPPTCPGQGCVSYLSTIGVTTLGPFPHRLPIPNNQALRGLVVCAQTAYYGNPPTGNNCWITSHYLRITVG